MRAEQTRVGVGSSGPVVGSPRCRIDAGWSPSSLAPLRWVWDVGRVLPGRLSVLGCFALAVMVSDGTADVVGWSQSSRVRRNVEATVLGTVHPQRWRTSAW